MTIYLFVFIFHTNGSILLHSFRQKHFFSNKIIRALFSWVLWMPVKTESSDLIWHSNLTVNAIGFIVTLYISLLAMCEIIRRCRGLISQSQTLDQPLPLFYIGSYLSAFNSIFSYAIFVSRIFPFAPRYIFSSIC